MDYYIDDIEEEERLRRRRERLERMRREKQLQMKRRRRMKMLVKRATAVMAIILVITVSITAFKGIDKKTNEIQEEIVENISLKPEVAVAQMQQTETEVAQIPQAERQESEQNTRQLTEVSDKTVSGEVTLAQKTTLDFQFDTTEETESVYSEEIISSNIILIDENADTIVASKGAKERISPASMTKVLTILVAAENITKEQLDDTFTMTREITDYSYVNDCSTVGFLDGEKVTVRDLFYGTILTSGSDAAVGLATYVAGSHEAFVDMMNEKLVELGLGDTSHYTNCVGLYDKEHYSTVYDMAVIMKAAIQSEFCKDVLAAHRYVTEATTEHPEGIDISNWFLRRIEDKDTGGEVLCAKTGYVMQSKNCAVSYGTFSGGAPYICVTAGSSSSWRCIYDHVEIYNQYI